MKRIFSLMLCFFVCVFSSSSSSDENLKVIRRVITGEKKIAITFDDGPHYKYTGEILDILKEYGVHATFFVVGSNALAHPDLIEREISEGHEIGNHTNSHVYLRGISDKNIEDEILKTQNAVSASCDFTPHLLRPPGGIFDEKLTKTAETMGYTIVLWSVDTRDWSHPDVSTVVDDVLDHIKSGDIILMHDFIGGSPSPTPDALRYIIPELLNEGYEFVTVTELMECMR